MIIEVLLVALAIMMISLSGIIFLHKTTKNFLENKLSYLVSFSAGVFLVASVTLSLEVFELTSVIWWGLLYILIGYAVAWLLHLFLPETHHHHDTDCSHSHGGARKLIVGDSIHNIADGIVLGSAFMVSPILGLTVAYSIVIHEFLQEISEFFVLKQAGYSTKRALLINFAVSGTILIGVMIGYFALAFQGLEALLLGVSAGFFFHVVVHDLLPKKIQYKTKSSFISHIAFVIFGLVAMTLVSVLVLDAH